MNSRRFVFIGAAVALLPIGLLAGCGSGGGTTSIPGQPIGTGSSTASFAGRSYASTIALSGGQVGNLSVTTNADGIATGSLQIVDPSREVTAKSRVVVASPLVSGTIDLATGAIHLTGSYALNGQTVPISINGTLPTPPSTTGGSITATVNGQNFTAAFGGGTSPTPTPSASGSANPSPSPSASATPTPTPSASSNPVPSGPRAFSGDYKGFVATATTSIAASTTPVTVNLVGSDGGGVRVDSAIVPNTINTTYGPQNVTVLRAGTRLIQATFASGAKAYFNDDNGGRTEVNLSTSGELQQNIVLGGSSFGFVNVYLSPCTIGPWKIANSVHITVDPATLPFSFTGSVPAVPLSFSEETKSTLTFTYAGKKGSAVGIGGDFGLYGFSTESSQTVLTNPQNISLHALADKDTFQNLTMSF